MSKRVQGGQPEELEIQANLLGEDQDMQDELEENVGVPPRKVTMEEFVGAEQAFNDLIESEEIEFETTPFRPGKNTRFVLTDNQKRDLKAATDEFDKYLKYEIDRFHNDDKEANQKLIALNAAMKKIQDVGLDGLSQEERKTVNEFNNAMNTKYPDSENRELINYMFNMSGPIGLKMSKIHRGLDMLGVMTGIPATYPRNRAESLKDGRAADRADTVEKLMFDHPEEAKELVETANSAGIKQLRDQFKGTEIGEKLGQICDIVEDLNRYKYNKEYLPGHLKAADDLGTFLNAEGKNGKKNYDTIAEAILGKKQNSEQKKAFDLLLGQLNTVCDLDIGVPYAIEAKAEHDWNRNQDEEIGEEQIKAFSDSLFGRDRKIFVGDQKDKEFLDSVDTLHDMIEKAIRNKLTPNTENYSKMFSAYFGLEKITEKLRSNNALARLEVGNDSYLGVLKFGKTLHQDQDGKKIYDILAETYEQNGKSKEDLNKTLLDMNEKFGLKIVIPGMEIEGQKAKPVVVNQAKPYLRKITEVQRSSNRMEDPVELKAALATTLALRRMSVDPAHKDHTKVRTQAVLAKTKALMDTEAFKTLTEKMSPDELAKKIKHAGNFDKEFTKKLKELDEAKYAERLKNPGFQSKLAASARYAARKMDETGTGVYMFGIKRGSNSGMYDRAVLAMRRAGKNPDAATTMQSVQAVKEYLSNKMPPRKSPSGKERWKDCMVFLHEAMPADEFKAYCDEINKVRKVKEGDSNFIKPEHFVPDAQVQRNSVPADPEKNRKDDIAGQEIGGRNSM